MLRSYEPQPDFGGDDSERVLLQLLLFVDERPSSQEHIKKIQAYLKSLECDYSFELDIIEINKQPHLVEHFKLVATPALVKISPLPSQTLAGSNLIEQLKKWWPKWQAFNDNDSYDRDSQAVVYNRNSIKNSGEVIRLSDEIFRLQKENEELTKQLRFKEQILAMLAHDLRSPLTAASIAVETIELSEQQQLDPEKLAKLKKQLFKQARRQFDIMNRLIGELLQASQRMSAKLKVEPRKLELHPLCDEAIAQFDLRFQEKSLVFHKDIPQDIPLVYADKELIRQLIVNLLDNAIKYTPEGGNISLSILHRTSQKVQVSICDTGPGIPPEKRERIFEGHFRLQRDRASEGYGLGLALCHKIVCAHYGQIWVDSSPKKWQLFSIYPANLSLTEDWRADNNPQSPIPNHQSLVPNPYYAFPPQYH